MNTNRRINWLKTVTREATLVVEIYDLIGERDIYPQKLGIGLKNKIYFPQGDDRYTYFFCKEEWEEFAQRIVDKIKNDKNWLKKETANIYKTSYEWQKIFQPIPKLNFKQITNHQLYQYYDNYGQGRGRFSFSLYAPLVTERFLEKELKSKNLIKKYWRIITTKIKLNALEEERVDLLKIAVKYKKVGEINKNIDNLLQKHTDKFGWLPFYCLSDPIWDKAYFVKNLKNIRSPKKELKNILNKTKENKKALSQVKTKFKNNRKLITLINFIQEYLYLRTYRTDMLRQSYYHIKPLLVELSERIKLKFDETLFLIPCEVRAFLLKNIFPDSKDIKKRKKHCAIVMRNGIIEIKSDQKELTKIKKELEQITETTIKGRSACLGIAQGPVRIIKSSRDINTLQKGEVLVTSMTTPDMTIAMGKAVAIVTDEGGITCHAAIVSRELNIPCIIGTQNATKLLKTGDLILVNANSGTVEKIK